ncbi:hypothetical protein Q3G72_029109 [Acer saccharum]|nr:hypothetical protein Q3G72_029109 [Acer saccharum]
MIGGKEFDRKVSALGPAVLRGCGKVKETSITGESNLAGKEKFLELKEKECGSEMGRVKEKWVEPIRDVSDQLTQNIPDEKSVGPDPKGEMMKGEPNKKESIKDGSILASGDQERGKREREKKISDEANQRKFQKLGSSSFRAKYEKLQEVKDGSNKRVVSGSQVTEVEERGSVAEVTSFMVSSAAEDMELSVGRFLSARRAQ